MERSGGHCGDLSAMRWRICSSFVTSFTTSLAPAAHFLEEQELVEFDGKKGKKNDKTFEP